MSDPKRFRKKPDQYVIAVRLNLEMRGLIYRKWGSTQRCKPGDWIVDNDGDTYTVDATVFARTYRKVAPGQYLKRTPVWAKRAESGGSVVTKEGKSRYRTGDYLVSNRRDGTDSYCVSAAKFRAMYEPYR